MNAVECAVLADDERGILYAVKSFERQITAHDGVRSQPRVRRQSSIEPPAFF
jgi:hypothetical protein